MPDTRAREMDHVRSADVEAGLAVARLFTGISVRAVAATDNAITLPQLRVLMMIDESGPTNVATVGRGLGVHSSNATRVVERLVRAGLIARRTHDDDRRHLVVELTAAGRAVVHDIDEHRRAEIAAVLGRVPAGRRDDAAALLAALAAAGARPASA
ncbi:MULTISPECIES: MarR family transcriptional regulator [unclassified Pseudonocardia]|uniref:MarR family transcriptional regulator n=1 Tax=unclassified Pseudonocardia TaxID=2619320 RepID=UPI000963B97B|nr:MULTISPECIES: MarR family transcriptional regulator [unclassified Pseudonocardia]OLM17727.1 Transcriptional regulator, MarR family [Pseudonocardia sp. Ae707_Ps1]